MSKSTPVQSETKQENKESPVTQVTIVELQNATKYSKTCFLRLLENGRKRQVVLHRRCKINIKCKQLNKR